MTDPAEEIGQPAPAEDGLLIDIVVPDPGAPPRQSETEANDPWADLDLDNARQVMGQRDVYAKAALGILQAWVGFLMVIILSQIVLRTMGTGLHDQEFIVTITTTTTSIIAFTFIVARYLFPEGGSNEALKTRRDRSG